MPVSATSSDCRQKALSLPRSRNSPPCGHLRPGLAQPRMLEEMLNVSRALERPIAMFVDQSDDAMFGAAIEAGISAYVVDGSQGQGQANTRARNPAFQCLFAPSERAESARTELAECEIIERQTAADDEPQGSRPITDRAALQL